MGPVLGSCDGGLDSIAVFYVLQSSLLARSYCSLLGDSVLEARYEKEAWGCFRKPLIKHSSFGGADLLHRMEGQ